MLELETYYCCGVIMDGGDYSEVFCNPKTGDLVFECNTDDCVLLISELSISDPTDLQSTSALKRQIEGGTFGDCVGVVVTKSGVYVFFEDGQVEKRSLLNPKELIDGPYEYNTNEEYEIE